jgi:tRNA A-37 threonylcarbamoyl transferase component Bud32
MKMDEERLETTLAGKYRIQTIIQKGGMGTVFEGSHVELGKKIAVKILHPHYAQNREVTHRFLNEARGTARLQHRNIVDVLDIGADEDGIPFFVMEHLAGESLKERFVRRGGRLSLTESADIMIQVLTGLYVAHGRGIVHRDIKPGNIFIAKEADGSEVVKILDFGVAKFRELELEDLTELTSSGFVVGTPAYMSPEQAAGRKSDIDYRTDIYSCGLVLYRSLTGTNPFMGETHYETIQAIVNRQAPPPSEIVGGLPPAVDAAILRAVEKKKEDRFQDCRAFIEAMEVFYGAGDSRPSDFSLRIPREITPGQAADYELGSGVFRGRRGGGPWTGRGGAIALVGLLVIAAVVYLVFFREAGNDGGPARILEASRDAESGLAESNLAGETSVQVRLSGLPEGAVIKVDDVVHTGNPIRLEPSDKPSTIVVTADGREILRQTFVPDHNETFQIITAPDAHPPAVKDATQKPGKKKKKDGEPQPPDGQDQGTKKSEGGIYKDFPE